MSEVGNEIGKRTRDHAMKVEKDLKELIDFFGPRAWKMGFLILEIHDKKLWQVRGKESENEYRTYLRVGRSTWFRTRRLTQEVGKQLVDREIVTREALNRLTLENAEQLLRLPENKRFDKRWVTKALTMTEDQFEQHVDHAVLNDTEPETALGKKESQAIIKIYCVKGQKDFIVETLEKVAEANDIPKDDLGKALEVLCADWMGGTQEASEKHEYSRRASLQDNAAGSAG